ncbi:ABC transporter substrate-binding protein [Bifidobacterium sp.]|jgi:cellobiose transport system substrate-binding protein|uniref:ABC transporter substrate-binding protein n=1 Tax=Bifidobacterium sp. TaxID=41200 RepID=UPI0025C22D07|nr:extracellular solute-binding protein [Bifidobacterium sp.]MCI1224796.1 extracellular solute-binding protein [Bifidobacterium sp.]
MKRSTRILASVTAIAALASMAACGSSNSQNGAKSGGKTVIKIQTFNNFGYGKPSNERPGADLWTKYEKEHPNIKIEETVASGSDDARSAFNTAISSGSNAYDIYAADIAWMPSITAMPDKFMDLKDYLKNNDWLDWKTQGATTANGEVIGAGNDIGPTAVCYRSDLFAKAGLPTDRDEVAKLLGGDSATWDTYFQVGKQYTEKTGLPWYDAMGGIWGAMKTQIEEAYVKKDGTVIATDSKIKSLYDQLTATTDMSAHLNQWSDDWNANFKSDKGFATIMCPAWLVNNIKGNSGSDFKGWDIADVTPGGGSNQGGSWLVVPKTSKVQDEAAKLVAWLTAPEQQVATFKAASNYPSSPKAMADPAVADKTDTFLNNAPTGKIFADRAKAVTVVPYTGAQYYDIDSKMGDALGRVDVTQEQSAAQSWNQYVNDVKALS